MRSLHALPRRIDTLDLPFDDRPWPFAAHHETAIAASWAARLAANPRLFDGRVVVATPPRISGTHLVSRCISTRYSAFLHAFKDGHSDGSALNIYGMAALASGDDALIAGVMAAHTASPGRIYFPAGTPDRDDIAHGRVDLDSSVRRELHEETGLTPTELDWSPGWWLIEQPNALTLMKPVRSTLDADALCALIRSRLPDTDGELSDVFAIRSPAEAEGERFPAFMTTYAHWWFSTGSAHG